MNKLPFGQTIRIKTPGTIANLVCGFDVMGFCLEEPSDIMQLTLIDSPEIILESNTTYPLPNEVSQNTAGLPLLAIQKQLNQPVGFKVYIDKKIKPGSGLGSSAASAAGASVGANLLLGNIFTNQELVAFAMKGEAVASGVEHPDNVTPCIYGGITLIRSLSPLDIISLPNIPLYVSVVHPQIEVKTADARAILKQKTTLKNAIQQWGNVGALIAGIYTKDYGLISRALVDNIVEPVRKLLIPGFDQVKAIGKDLGALGGGIAGSGPSLFMLSEQQNTALQITQAMEQVYAEMGIDCHTYTTPIGNNGVQLINE